MKALDAFRDVLRELDAWQSSPFSIKQFNYFYTRAISAYVADNYSQFDVKVKENDDIGSIVVLGEALTVSNVTKSVNLPSVYRHFLGAKVKVKFTAVAGKYKVNDTRFHYVDRQSSAEKSFSQKNAYDRPSWRNIRYQLAGGAIVFDAGSKVEFTTGANCWLDYIKIPPAVYLNPDRDSDYNDSANNSVLFFNTATLPNHIYFEINALCARLFMENTRNPRLQTLVQNEASIPK